MFTTQQKRIIAMKVQTILRETCCDELPEGEIDFILHVDGAEGWSWANIRNEGNKDFAPPSVLVQNLGIGEHL